MDTTTLNIANALNQKIENCTEVLHSRIWNNDNLTFVLINKEGDEITIPVKLTHTIKCMLKDEVAKEREICVRAFNDL